VFVDVGNSAIKLGIAEIVSTQIDRYKTCRTAEECRHWLGALPSDTILFYSSVRPGFDIQSLLPAPSWKTISAEQFIDREKIKFPERLDIGIDRKLACLAADQMVAQPLIAIALGTTTTLTCISENTCDFSVIWPGIGLSLAAIENNTRILVGRELRTLTSLDKTIAIQDSVHLGVLMSTLFTCEGWLEHFRQRFNQSPNTIVTGGYAIAVSKFLHFQHRTESDLTLKGLSILFSHHKEVFLQI